MYHRGFYATPSFTKGERTTNWRFRIWSVDRWQRPIRRRFYPRFLHGKSH